jgi:DNA topoisomerase-3
METAGKLVTDEALKEALKEKSLGTPATRAAIIETILARGYVTRENKG